MLYQILGKSLQKLFITTATTAIAAALGTKLAEKLGDTIIEKIGGAHKNKKTTPKRRVSTKKRKR